MEQRETFVKTDIGVHMKLHYTATTLNSCSICCRCRSNSNSGVDVRFYYALEKKTGLFVKQNKAIVESRFRP